MASGEVSKTEEWKAAMKQRGVGGIAGGWVRDTMDIRLRERTRWDALVAKLDKETDLRRNLELRKKLSDMDLLTAMDTVRGLGWWGQILTELGFIGRVLFPSAQDVFHGGRVGDINLPERGRRVAATEHLMVDILRPGEVRFLASEAARLAVAEKQDLNNPTKDKAFIWLEKREAVVNVINKLKTSKSRAALIGSLTDTLNSESNEKMKQIIWEEIQTLQRLEKWVQAQSGRGLNLQDNMTLENSLSFGGTPVAEGGLGWNGDDKELLRAIYYLKMPGFKAFINDYNQKYNRGLNPPIPLVP